MIKKKTETVKIKNKIEISQDKKIRLKIVKIKKKIESSQDKKEN